jgi:hypothetical protein
MKRNMKQSKFVQLIVNSINCNIVLKLISHVDWIMWTGLDSYILYICIST